MTCCLCGCSGNIRVFCRVRPLLGDEVVRADPVCASFPSEGEIAVTNARRQRKASLCLMCAVRISLRCFVLLCPCVCVCVCVCACVRACVRAECGFLRCMQSCFCACMLLDTDVEPFCVHQVWEFDQVFQPGTSNETVFAQIAPLLTSVLDGYNVCIFAYGQTGSGKTVRASLV